MKFNNKYLLALGILPMLTGCADYIDTYNNFTVEKPASLTAYEYLDEYNPIKSYIDRAKYPNFLLGAGVDGIEYGKMGSVYPITNANFDIVTAGNEMKYASIVNDNGAMNFGNVAAFVDAATRAGIQVYGHTLCWHEQQNVKWLNSLLKDKEMDVDPNEKVEVVDYEINYGDLDGYALWHQPEDGPAVFSINKEEGCFQVENPAAVNFWEVQYFTFDNVNFVKGQNYVLTVTLRATEEGNVQGNVGGWSENTGINIPYSTEWTTRSITFTAANDGASHGLFQTGDLVGTIQYKSLKISHFEAPVKEIGVSVIHGGDAENGETANLIARVAGNEDVPAPVVDDPLGTGKVFRSDYNADPVQTWDSQFFIVSDEPLDAGTKIHVKFRYRATDSRSIETQAHGAPGSYHHWAFIGTLNATEDWKVHEYTGQITSEQAGAEGCSAIAFNLCGAASAGSFYVDDVVFEKYISANTVPMTDEEKREALTKEMERWVKGMMEVCNGRVKYWDVVNEAISGGPWGQKYDLQHAATCDDPSNKFFWQDYLGDNFVRVPVRFARQYFEEFGGNPDELKLFVNDYNLESDWDDNQKLKSLIQWIQQWESDGVTKIDGIGSQMHISYYLNPNTQKSKENHIVKMFELMAASGKLCRITELDMGLVDENGNDIKTEDVTFEQHRLMAEYYKWIIQKYLEIIPVDQQSGITQWCQTDSPDGSGWRGGQPVGLWNLNWQRKPAYAGFCEGFQGK